MELWCSLGSVNLNLDSNFTTERRPPRKNEVTGPSLANRQPILIKLWILYLMTNPSKVYDNTPNLNQLKYQLITTISNA